MNPLAIFNVDYNSRLSERRPRRWLRFARGLRFSLRRSGSAFTTILATVLYFGIAFVLEFLDREAWMRIWNRERRDRLFGHPIW